MLSFPDKRYEIRRFVANGSMGEVYQGLDTKLNRPVALKKIRKSVCGNALQSALQEGRAQALLNHPNIVQVYDVINTDTEVWIISEWIEGRTLDALAWPLHPIVGTSLLIQILCALARMHQQNILHRDIKPSNIMLTTDGRVVVIDFGVAFTPWGSSGETLVGTLRYTDPKLLEGSPADVLSDLFSLSILVLEVLVGKQFLPELAPLPLHQYLRRQLPADINLAVEGMFPPLRTFIAKYGSGNKKLDGKENPLTLAEDEASKLSSLLAEMSYPTAIEILKTFARETSENAPSLNAPVKGYGHKIVQDRSISVLEKTAWISFLSKHGQPEEMTSIQPKNRKLRITRPWLAGAISLVVLLAIAGSFLFKPAPPSRDVKPAELAAPSAAAVQAPAISPPVQAKTEKAPPLKAKVNSQVMLKKIGITIIANAWADVFIDGKLAGRLPRAMPFILSEGPHVIKLVNPAMVPYEQKIHVHKKSSPVLRISLRANEEGERNDATNL